MVDLILTLMLKNIKKVDIVSQNTRDTRMLDELRTWLIGLPK